MSLSFYEFFAGGGMARLGLGDGWECLFANDICEKKAAAWRANFSEEASRLRVGDVWELSAADLPGRADLAWASFPCQDLSLAGSRHGLSAPRSGAFWGFWRLIRDLTRQGRAPSVVLLENVVGLLTSHRGEDFRRLLDVMRRDGWRAGALVMDAAHFTPQSRPRLFIMAIRQEADWRPEQPPAPCWLHPSLMRAFDRLPEQLRDHWLWLPVPAPPPRLVGLEHVLESALPDDCWLSPEESRRLLACMSPSNQLKLEQARALSAARDGMPVHGAGYRRTRVEQGVKRQRFEVRFDGLAGCLRTPGGGSSRQFIVETTPERTRIRLLRPREAARLMGLPEHYRLPERYNDAYRLCGDGVVVPVVRWLARHAIEPVLGEEAHDEEHAKRHHSLSLVS